jgi:hypothetical protein
MQNIQCELIAMVSTSGTFAPGIDGSRDDAPNPANPAFSRIIL